MILEIVQLLVDLALVAGLLHLWRQVRRLEKKPSSPAPAVKGSSVPVDVVAVILSILLCGGAFAQPPVEEADVQSFGTGLQYGDGAGGFSEVTSSSVSGANVTLGGSVILSSVGSAASPVIRWDVTGTPGFYSTGAYNISVGSNGAETFRFDTANGFFRAAATQGFFAAELPATATRPSVGPANNDTDTGLGLGGSDDLRLIAGGSSGLGVTTTAVTNYRAAFQSTAQATPPVTCNAGNLGASYADSSGGDCYCNGTAWANRGAVGDCS